MAMEIGSTYGAHTDSYASASKTSKKTAESKGTSQAKKTTQPKLSERAQKLLEKLRKTYGNMDFMVADFEGEADAKSILSRGTKEFSVLFSSEELEKMAADEKVEQEYMGRLQQAVNMSQQINQQFGFESVLGKNVNGSEITRVGVSFNSDGSMSFFAELEKVNEKQRERIEEAGEEKLSRKKEEAKKAEKEKWEDKFKRTTVWADSLEELFEKIKSVDWNKINFEDRTESGKKLDFSV